MTFQYKEIAILKNELEQIDSSISIYLKMILSTIENLLKQPWNLARKNYFIASFYGAGLVLQTLPEHQNEKLEKMLQISDLHTDHLVEIFSSFNIYMSHALFINSDSRQGFTDNHFLVSMSHTVLQNLINYSYEQERKYRIVQIDTLPINQNTINNPLPFTIMDPRQIASLPVLDNSIATELVLLIKTFDSLEPESCLFLKNINNALHSLTEQQEKEKNAIILGIFLLIYEQAKDKNSVFAEKLLSIIGANLSIHDKEYSLNIANQYLSHYCVENTKGLKQIRGIHLFSETPTTSIKPYLQTLQNMICDARIASFATHVPEITLGKNPNNFWQPDAKEAKVHTPSLTVGLT